ncbi:MAG: ABC transporter permease [Acidobacteriota bacterium]
MSSDLRFAIRQLLRNKTFTAVALTVLTLAVGANILVFSLVHPVLFEPLPFPEPDRLVRILHVDAAGRARARVSEAQAQAVLRDAETLQVSAAENTGLAITDSETPLNPLMRRVSDGHFELLGVTPLLGRTFTPEEHRGDAARVLVLHEAFWHSYFGGDDAVLGRTLELADEPYEIVGVIPATFNNPIFPQPPVLWLPYGEKAESPTRANVTVIGRTAPDAGRRAVGQELQAIADDVAAVHPEALAGSTLRAEPLHRSLVAPMRPALLMLLFAVGLVLLVACGNIANLLLARAISRRQEIAVRLALGAGRWQLARQLLIEGLVLALISGALGLLLASWTLGPLLALAPANTPLPMLERISIDGEIVLFTLGLALAVSLIFGLLPLTQLRRDVADRLSAGATRAVGGGGRIRRGLVIAEIALSTLLLVAAGLTLRSLEHWRSLSPGFDPDGLVTGRVGARGPGFETPDSFEPFHRRSMDELAALPGVERVAACQFLPQFAGTFGNTTAVTREPEAALEKWPRAVVMASTPGFFETFGQPLLAGRGLNDLDRSDTPDVAVISRNVEARLWGELGASIGEELWLADGDPPKPVRIVGVAGDLRGLITSPEPPAILYRPLAQHPVPNLTYLFRTRSTIEQLKPAVEATVWSQLTRDAPVYSFRDVGQLMRDIEWQPRFMVQLLSVFATLALVMAAAGLYGVLAYTVAERRREIGLRMAVGANRRQIVRRIQGDAARLGAVGLGLGLAASFAAGLGFEQILLGVAAFDAATYGGVLLVLTSVIGVASWLPAWRASQVDPVEALRTD